METSRPFGADPAAVTFPKTCKRGVPQQFPRRLYEMLETEAARHEQQPNESTSSTQLVDTAQPSLILAPSPTTDDTDDDSPLIAWSPTGRAFRITDNKRFADEVLPSYFRTSKFSSFQRNLNLYGFSKVRHGPDADMYAHPSFKRGKPENLVLLRKLTNAADRQRAVAKLAAAANVQQREGKEQQQQQAGAKQFQGMIATATAASSASTPPPTQHKRSVSVTSTDYFSSSSSLSAAGSGVCYAASTTTSDDGAEDIAATASVTTAYHGISISDLIQTYQKSVSNVRPPAVAVSSSSSVASDSAETATQHHQKRRHSADSLEDNKLALLAFAMTSMAGKEMEL